MLNVAVISHRKAFQVMNSLLGLESASVPFSYPSGGYTMKEIRHYFQIHYSVVSRIVAISKKLKNAK